MCFLDGTGGDKGGIRGPAVGFPAWRWSIPGGGHVCSGSFVAERNRRQRKGELRSPDGCCPRFSLALISETEGVRDLWKMQLGSDLPEMEDPDAFQE